MIVATPVPTVAMAALRSISRLPLRWDHRAQPACEAFDLPLLCRAFGRLASAPWSPALGRRGGEDNPPRFTQIHGFEGFATNKEWRRAYREINEFELMLVDSGIRLVKLFLHITPDEQVRRFRDRLIDPVKRWKLSYEDFRNHTRSDRTRRTYVDLD